MADGLTIPAETELLCEGCGYSLAGLPDPSGARCPECGKPTSESAPELRHPPAWEQKERPLYRRWLDTTFAVWFRPTAFYRSLTTRGSLRESAKFAHVHWFISSVGFAAAAWVHFGWADATDLESIRLKAITINLGVFLVDGLLIGTTRLAARLTAWEAAYRGIRLPLPVVLRGMHYHAAHYVPVACVAVATVVGYQFLLIRGVVTELSATTYVYVLAAEVVIGAIYLFQTYWIGMRNMMYANR